MRFVWSKVSLFAACILLAFSRAAEATMVGMGCVEVYGKRSGRPHKIIYINIVLIVLLQYTSKTCS